MTKRQNSNAKNGISHHFQTKVPAHVAQKAQRHECGSLKGARSCKWSIQPR